ncbi:hypothetical protein CRE_31189 [Caenorhabditis remanei]|uniref:Uncharacterized protein n=1 Tax=Caenorhabditis remanei TaxID=31234 RepID=E3MLH5_CAERE|nr:hypothetical protein CRE_31189 [Caenorhabditis remanei]
MDNALFRPLGNISQLQKALQPRFCDADLILALVFQIDDDFTLTEKTTLIAHSYYSA